MFTIGTVTRDDHITKDVFISHEDPSGSDPVLQIALPPKSVELVIQALQERANEARFVNGEPMLEYPEPIRDTPKRKRKTQARKPSGQQESARDQ